MSDGDWDATTPGGSKASGAAEAMYLSALIAVWPSMACAKITIRQAQYTGGMLLVRGETARAGQTVTLAGRYKTRTDRNGRFRFRARYLPRDCLLDVRSGPELDLVSIANCKPR